MGSRSANWTAGNGEGHAIRVEARATVRGFESGFDCAFFDNDSGEFIGGGALYNSRWGAMRNGLRLVFAWWPKAAIVRVDPMSSQRIGDCHTLSRVVTHGQKEGA
jgi:hypothetical protein